MPIQSSYEINPDVGFKGRLAEPNSPHRLDNGVLQLAAAATYSPEPGDFLIYDKANNAFALPADQAGVKNGLAILSYRQDTVQTGKDRDTVTFGDGDEIEVVTLGVVWLEAGGAVEYGDQLAWPFDDRKWDALARVATVAAMHQVPVFSVNREAVADGDLFKAAIGYGRAL